MAQTHISAQELQRQWGQSPRWNGVKRDYGAEEVVRERTEVRGERHCIATSETAFPLLR